MTVIQVNGSPSVSNSASRSIETKGLSQFATSFASEIEAILGTVVSETGNEASATNIDVETSLLETLETLINALETLAEEAEKGKDVSDAGEVAEELYAALQQIYQLLNQLATDTQQGQSRTDDGKAVGWLQKTFPFIQSEVLWQVTNNQSLSEMKQKLTDIMTYLNDKKPGVLPQDFASNLKALVSRLENTDNVEQQTKVVQTSSFQPVMQKLDALTSNKELQQEKQTSSFQPVIQKLDALTSNRELQQEKQTSTFSEPSTLEPSVEEGTLTKAMHHQMQGNPLTTKEEGSIILRNVNLPLVPARFFANEMEVYILKQAHLNRDTGALETTLRLFPENLGRVDVRITALNGSITAHFVANQAAGKEAIEQQLNQLRNALIQQGLHVEKIEVSYVTTTQGEQSNNNLFQQGKEQPQQQNREKEQSQEESPEFNLAELLGEETEGEPLDTEM